MTEVLAIWAEGVNHHGRPVIGDSLTNSIPWPRNPDDMSHFREQTRDRVLVMGRRTYDSLPAGMKTAQALAERPMLVLTTAEHLQDAIAQVRVPGSLNTQPLPTDRFTPLEMVQASREWFGPRDLAVIGGARAIEWAEPVVDRLEVTVMPPDQRYYGDVPAPGIAFLERFRFTEERRAGRLTFETYHKKEQPDG